MTVYGYARVSTDRQSLVAQDAELHKTGAAKVYRETFSGAVSRRLQLEKLLRVISEGDVVMVTRLDRLARSTRDLLNILDKISKAGAQFKSLRESWADTTTPVGRLMATIIGGMAEFERELIRAGPATTAFAAPRRQASTWGATRAQQTPAARSAGAARAGRDAGRGRPFLCRQPHDNLTAADSCTVRTAGAASSARGTRAVRAAPPDAGPVVVGSAHATQSLPRSAHDAWQHPRQWRALAHGELLAVPPSGSACGRCRLDL